LNIVLITPYGDWRKMKKIVEGILKELNVDYITENDINKIDKSKIILYWDIGNEEKMKDFNSKFLLGD